MTPVVLLLSDGAPALARFADALRDAGFRVAATPLPHEFSARRADPEVVVAAAPARLLTPRVAALLRSARDDATLRPFVLVLADGGAAPEPDVADAVVPVDDADAALAAAMEAARARGADVFAPVTRPAPAPAPAETVAAPPVAEPPSDARLAEIARRLTETEHDVDRLLDAALDAFLEVAAARCGSLLLAPEEGRLEAVRRSGFRADEDPSEAEVEAGAAAARSALRRTVAADGEETWAAPMVAGRTILGVLVARGVGAPSPQRSLAAEVVARQAAANYANARQLSELRQAAVIDPLTGLFNRRFFERQLRLEIERARRHRRQVMLAIIDVDSFKRFNGFNGYDVGDQVIRETAGVLRANFREIDVVTRWGGDEFAVILPETGRRLEEGESAEEASRFVDRVRRAVAEHAFQACAGAKVTISAGVASYPSDASDAKGLFQTANQALLQAKRGGNNRVCVVGPEGLIKTAYGA